MTAQLSCKSAQHYTPGWLVELARHVLEEIDMDPMTNRLANAQVRAPRWVSITEPHQFPGDDGLAVIWGGRVLCNPAGDKRGTLVRAAWSRANDHAMHGGPGAVVFWVGFSLEQQGTLQSKCPPVRGRPCPAPQDWPMVEIKSRVRYMAPRWRMGGRSHGDWLLNTTTLVDDQVVVGCHWTPSILVPALRVGTQPTHRSYVSLLGGDAAMRARFRELCGPLGKYTGPRRRPQPAHDLAGDILAVLRSRGPLSKRGVAHLVRRRKETVFKTLDELVARQLVEQTSDKRFGLVGAANEGEISH
ncbi:MAG: hypothetical protein AAGC55_26805 [Myxococcota bacterium]